MAPLNVRRPTVLLIEDEPAMRAALTAQLEALGYGVLAAPHGEAALALLQRERPAALLVDLMMPVMDGVEFRRRQLASPSLARIPVAFLASTGPLRSFSSSVGAPILIKPAATEALAEVLQRLLRAPDAR
jgi:CheY-like chemotaxis protein